MAEHDPIEIDFPSLDSRSDPEPEVDDVLEIPDDAEDDLSWLALAFADDDVEAEGGAESVGEPEAEIPEADATSDVPPSLDDIEAVAAALAPTADEVEPTLSDSEPVAAAEPPDVPTIPDVAVIPEVPTDADVANISGIAAAQRMPEALLPDAVLSDAGSPEVPTPEVARSDVAQSDVAQSDVAQSEVAPSEVPVEDIPEVAHIPDVHDIPGLEDLLAGSADADDVAGPPDGSDGTPATSIESPLDAEFSEDAGSVEPISALVDKAAIDVSHTAPHEGALAEEPADRAETPTHGPDDGDEPGEAAGDTDPSEPTDGGSPPSTRPRRSGLREELMGQFSQLYGQ